MSHAPQPDDFGTRPLAVFLQNATSVLAASVLRDRLQKKHAQKMYRLVWRRRFSGPGSCRRTATCGTRTGSPWARLRSCSATPEHRVVRSEHRGQQRACGGGGCGRPQRRIRERASICPWRAGADGLQVLQVHPYEKLPRANVLGTLSAIELAADGKSKSFVLVSSTLALHTEHYIRVLDTLVGRPVDNRGRPRVGLPGRYSVYPQDRIWLDSVGARGTHAQGRTAETLWVHAVSGLSLIRNGRFQLLTRTTSSGASSRTASRPGS
jgi:L-aminoadipate-semialdehyde dehydrogenase